MYTKSLSRYTIKEILFLVPNRVWTINELTKEELEELRTEIDFNRKKDSWWEQEPLKSLDLSSNSLISLDPQINNLLDLTFLDVNITFYIHTSFMLTLKCFSRKFMSHKN